MTRWRGTAALLASVVLLAAACTGDGRTDVSPSQGPPTRSKTPSASKSPPPLGRTSAADALVRLCGHRPPAGSSAGGPSPSGETPPEVAEVEAQIQDVRGLEFVAPVPVEAVSADELSRRLAEGIEGSFPDEQYERRSQAWQTIGVLPPDVTIREALDASAAGGQVIGFYRQDVGDLVYLGEEGPGALEKLTLAHELTHALDDQHFHLERVDRIDAQCRDEEAMAALGAIEGSAELFSVQWATRNLDLEDLGSLLDAPVPSTAGIPPFFYELQVWPYFAGQSFMTARFAQGGEEAVNEALQDFPDTTEQVMHPDRYPDDASVAVDVPDYGPVLGKGWKDLDVMRVGEAWLDIMLGLRLDDAAAGAAAAGWDGGTYRAWSDGERTAVVLATAWDSDADAQEFASAAKRWLGAGDSPGFASASGATAIVGFASDAASLEALRATAV